MKRFYCINRFNSIAGSLLLVAGLVTPSVFAQFSRTNVGFTATGWPAAAWGDYDNDGDLDLVIAGEAHGDKLTTLYQNNAGRFSSVTAPFIGVQNGALAWGDYDGDGDLDLVVCGETDTGVATRLYHNNGGTFVLAQVLTGLTAGSAAWGDYDNDGDLDLLLCGITGISPAGAPVLTLLYRNDKGTLVNVPTTLPALYLGSVAWGDFDRDGDLDLLLTGAGSSGFPTVTAIYRNDGQGVFTDINAGLPLADLGNAAWGDYDNDGDLDVVVVGNGADPGLARIFRNDAGTFTDSGAALSGVLWAWASWGDFDNDGDLDLAIMGYNGTAPETRVYRNDAGAFTDIGATLEPMYLGQNHWVDFNNDGLLELLLVGQRDVNLGTAAWLYRNLSASTNTPPTAPAGLGATVQGPDVELSWQRAMDAQTPAAALSYNVRLGTNSSGNQIVPAQALAANGIPLVPGYGNAQGRTNLQIKGLVPGVTYYWSVQSVDTSFARSAFANEVSFTVPVAASPGSIHIHRQGNDIVLNSTGTPGFPYGLDVTDQLPTTAIAWTRLTNVWASAEGVLQFVEPANRAQRFYRLVRP